MLTNNRYIFVLDAMAIALFLTGMITGSGALLWTGVVIACLASVLHLAVPFMGKRKPGQIPRASVKEEGASLYKDHLVNIFDHKLILFNYYFPTYRQKKLFFSDIERMRKYSPTLWNGKYRFHGTGNFKTWFPNDPDRSKRDFIYKISLKSQFTDICFTVTDSDKVEGIFMDKGLLAADPGRH